MLLLDPGDHVVFTEDVYGGTFRLFDQVFRRYGLTFTTVDPSDLDAIAAAMTDRTKLVWLESPTNPLLRIVDIDGGERDSRTGRTRCSQSTAPSRAQCCNARSTSAPTSSCTARRSSLAGTAMCSAERCSRRTPSSRNACASTRTPSARCRRRSIAGSCCGAQDARVACHRQCDNALAIARWLEGQDAVIRVHYPGLESNPGHALASAQMGGYYGGVVSFEVSSVERRARVSNGSACSRSPSHSAPSSPWPRAPRS